jgi:hypothetical protein
MENTRSSLPRHLTGPIDSLRYFRQPQTTFLKTKGCYEVRHPTNSILVSERCNLGRERVTCVAAGHAQLREPLGNRANAHVGKSAGKQREEGKGEPLLILDRR